MKKRFIIESTSKRTFWAKALFFFNLSPQPKGWGNCLSLEKYGKTVTPCFSSGISRQTSKRGVLTPFRCGLIIYLLLLSSVSGQSRGATVTLYKDGFGLVNQPVSFNLISGRNMVRYPLIPDRTEPNSPFLTLDGADIILQKYSHDTFNSFAFLRDQLGESVTVSSTDGQHVKGKLIGIDGKWITIESKRSVRILNIEEVVDITASKGDSDHSVRAELAWEINSPRKGTVPGELVYITGGFDWDANYRLIVSPDEKSGTIVAQALLKNETNLSFSSSRLELVEGELKRAQSGSRMKDRRLGARRESAAATDVSQSEALVFDQEILGDYVFYSLSQPVSVPAGESIAAPLYPDQKITFSRLYRFENNERSNREGPLSVELSFMNDKSSGLGIPLPAGLFQIYQQRLLPSGSTAVKFAGEDYLGQVAVGENAAVTAGRAFDVLGKRTVMNYDRKKKSEEGLIQLEIENKRDDTVKVEVVEHIFGDWVIREPSRDDYKKVDAQTIQFEFDLKPHASETISYTYRKEWQ